MTEARPIAAGRCGRTAVPPHCPGPRSPRSGHPPGRSPYHDIPKGHTVTAFAANSAAPGGGSGSRRTTGRSSASATTSAPRTRIQLGLGFARGNLERLIVDPFVAVAERVNGPVDQKVSFVEVNLQLNLTGGKTWHRLAPFVGVGGGLTFPSGTAADTSGFELGKKIYFAPHAGFRFFVTDRLHLRADARVLFWKLNYPTSFTQAPDARARRRRRVITTAG